MIMNYGQNQYSRTKDVNTKDFSHCMPLRNWKLERVPKRLHLKFDEMTSDYLPTFYAYKFYLNFSQRQIQLQHYNLSIS